MKHIQVLNPNGFYLFESLSAANTIFFESKDEIKLFKSLLYRYLKSYIKIHKIYIDASGYQLIIKIKQRRTLLKHYERECIKKGKSFKKEFIEEPWRIISERMRIFKSIYVKAVNKMRGREGVMVKHSYRRYLFETELEYESYVSKMEKGAIIESQAFRKFQESRLLVDTINWKYFRAKKWVESLCSCTSRSVVLHNEFIKLTRSLHSLPPP